MHYVSLRVVKQTNSMKTASFAYSCEIQFSPEFSRIIIPFCLNTWGDISEQVMLMV